MQGCTFPGCQVTMVTKFCKVVLNIFGFCVQNLLHVMLLMLKFWGGSYSSTSLSYCIIYSYCKWDLYYSGLLCLVTGWFMPKLVTVQQYCLRRSNIHCRLDTVPHSRRTETSNAALQKPKTPCSCGNMYKHIHRSQTEATCSHLFQQVSNACVKNCPLWLFITESIDNVLPDSC